MKKKNLRFGLIIIIILFIIIDICVMLLRKIDKNKEEQDINRPYIMENNIEQIAEDVIIPNNAYKFFGKYIEGEVSPKEIYEEIYKYGLNAAENNSKLKEISFDETTLKSTKSYTTGKLIFKYENNKEINIYVKVLIKKVENEKYIIFYKNNVEE